MPISPVQQNTFESPPNENLTEQDFLLESVIGPPSKTAPEGPQVTEDQPPAPIEFDITTEDSSLSGIVRPVMRDEILNNIIGAPNSPIEDKEATLTERPVGTSGTYGEEPEESRGFFNMLRAAAADIGEGVVESPRQILGGFRDLGEDVLDLVYEGGKRIRETFGEDLPEWASKVVVYDNGVLRFVDYDPSFMEAAKQIPEVKAPYSVTGGMIRKITEFAAAFLPAGRVIRGAGVANRWLNAAAAGVVADVLVTKQADERVSNLIESVPELKNPITEYLASTDEETFSEAKFKGAIEGLALGTAGDALLGGLRAYKAAHAAPSMASEVIDAGVVALTDPLDRLILGVESTMDTFPDVAKQVVRGKLDTLKDLPGRLLEMQKAGIPNAQIVNELEATTTSALAKVSALTKQFAADPAQMDELVSAVQNSLENTVSNAGEFLTGIQRGRAFEAKLQSLVGDPNAPITDIRGNINFGRIDSPQSIKEILNELVTEPRMAGSLIGKLGTGEIDRILTEITDTPLLKTFSKKLTASEVKKFAKEFNLPIPALRKIAAAVAEKQSREDIKLIISETIKEPEVAAAMARVQTHAQTQKLADELGLTVPELLANKKRTGYLPHEILARRNLMDASAAKIKELGALVDETGGETEKLALYRQFAIHRAIMEEIGFASKTAGQTLNIMKSVAKQTKGDVKAINEVTNLLSRGNLTIEQVASTITKLDDPAQVNKFIKDISNPKKLGALETLARVRVASFLTSPKTHAINMTSNTLNMFWQVPVRFLSSKTTAAGAEQVVEGEWIALARGSVEGFIDAMRAAKTWGFWKEGGYRHEISEFTSRPITRESLPALGIVSDYLGKAVDIPMKALGAEDEFFKTIAYRAELHAQAYRASRELGLRGREAAKSIREMVDNPDDLMRGRASDFAHYVTFQDKLEGFFGGMENLIRAHPALRLIVPFIRTQSNIWLTTMEHTPLAPLLNRYKDAIQAGGAEAQIALARKKLGTGLLAATAMLSAAGYVTGGSPADPNLRKTQQAVGKQPYSVRFGDDLIDFSRIEPAGSIMGLAADAINIASHINDSDTAWSIIDDMGLVLGHYLDNRTYFNAIGEFINAVYDPNKSKNMLTFARDFAFSATLPGQGGIWANRYVLDDKIMRDAREWLDQIMVRTPGLSKNVPPQRDVWGEPKLIRPGLGPDSISPLASSALKGDELSKTLLDRNLKVIVPERALDFRQHGREGVQLTADEYGAMSELVGKRNKKALSILVKNPGFKRAPQEHQQIMINRLVSKNKQIGKNWVYNEYPELQDRVRKRRAEYASDLLKSSGAQ